MFIDKNGKRVNIYTPYVHENTLYSLTSPETREMLGIKEIDRPAPPSDYDPDTYYVTETDEPPYFIYTPKSKDQILDIKKRRFEQILDSLMDTTAKEHRYNDRFTFALRAGYPGPFQEEGIAFAVWMDTCNALAYQVMDSVIRGEQKMPTEDEFVALFPPFVKP